MSFTKLLQPKLNPFGLYIYTHEDTSLNLKQYSNQKIAESKLLNFKGEGTYCNSFTHLFISESNDFWIINNSSFQIRYKKMQIKKKNHSMIFIPPLNSQKENGKIFIVGGDDKKSIYYDLKKNYFLNWAPTNEIHIKPALIQIGEYLYLFDSIFNKKNFCFEKTKLTDVKPRWEKIIPNIDENILNNFPSNTFAVSLDENNNIVFLGGDNINMSNNASYIYNINQNKIYLSQKGTNDCMNFIDKTFYKINGTYVALPEDISESKEIAIIDRNEQSLIKNSVNDNVQSRLCSECKKKEREQSNLNKINSITKNNLKMKYNNINEPKEFGYCMSSCSSEQSKITAKKNKIKIIEINQKYKKFNINTNIAANTNTNANIIINQQQKQERKIINQENNIINKEEIVQENINIINQAQVGKNQEEIIQNDNIEQNIETNIEQNIEQNQEEIKPVEISQENNENEIAQPEENPEEENNEQIEQVEQIEQKEEINEEQSQPQEMEVKIPEINEVQHEEQDNFSEEIKKQEEINTDINQEENVAQEAKTSVNVENNNIYIKDDVGENNEEHVEEHYEFIDHEEKEEHNEEQELHGEEEQNIEHEENIVHEDIEKEQEQEEINEENNEEHVDENEQELGEEQIEEHVDNEAQEEEEGEEQVEEHAEEEIHEEEYEQGQMEENVENGKNMNKNMNKLIHMLRKKYTNKNMNKKKNKGKWKNMLK